MDQGRNTALRQKTSSSYSPSAKNVPPPTAHPPFLSIDEEKRWGGGRRRQKRTLAHCADGKEGYCAEASDKGALCRRQEGALPLRRSGRQGGTLLARARGSKGTLRRRGSERQKGTHARARAAGGVAQARVRAAKRDACALRGHGRQGGLVRSPVLIAQPARTFQDRRRSRDR